VAEAAAAGVVFYWDFFGPRAEGTARHFLRHLDERLAREGIAAGETAVEEPTRGHWAVRCALTAPDAGRLRNALRPRREQPR
jgi:hypothetical protein